MSSRREQLRLHDVIDNIDAIQEYLGPRSFEELYADQMRVDAIERCLQRITEAVIKIGPQRMAQIMPALPAGKVRGMGNILRHHYDTLDARTVWGTITEALPPLREACERALTEADGAK